jgi:hypothetical protein
MENTDLISADVHLMHAIQSLSRVADTFSDAQRLLEMTAQVRADLREIIKDRGALS